jgi:hypothetical protein
MYWNIKIYLKEIIYEESALNRNQYEAPEYIVMNLWLP